MTCGSLVLALAATIAATLEKTRGHAFRDGLCGVRDGGGAVASQVSYPFGVVELVVLVELLL